ncbi:MAG: DUF3306 domain-containing protein [Geminicoccales bacterium]
MSRSESFFGRWSRLKGEARRESTETPQATEATPDASAGRPEARPDEPGIAAATRDARPKEVSDRDRTEPVDPDSLPPIESLTYESDYTVFLREGVPPEIRKQALQRLWRSDPVLANLDGLLEYGEDYSGIGKTKSIVRTAYRVGRGMLHDHVSEEERPQPAGEASEPPMPAEHQEVASAERSTSADSRTSDADHDDEPKGADPTVTRSSGSD